MSKKEEARIWWEAWRATRSEDVVVKLKVDVDWFWLALGVVFVMVAYKEIFG